MTLTRALRPFRRVWDALPDWARGATVDTIEGTIASGVLLAPLDAGDLRGWIVAVVIGVMHAGVSNIRRRLPAILTWLKAAWDGAAAQ